MYVIAYILLLFSLVFVIFVINNLGNDQSSLVHKRLMHLKLQAREKEGAIVQHKKISRTKWGSFIYSYIILFRKIGIEITEKEVFLLNGISYLSFFLIVFLLNKSIVISLFLGFLGLFLPYSLVSYLGHKRMLAFEKLFGDALYLMANTLQSGFGFRQAMQIVAQEMPSPVSDEFELLNQELNWGLSLPEAMSNFSERMPNEHVGLFVTAVMIQNEVGGSLANLLGKIAETIKNKQELKGEVKVLTSQGKASGLIVGLMPFAIAVLIMMINPEFIMPLFATPAGLAMVAVAVFLEIMGLFAIKLIVNIE